MGLQPNIKKKKTFSLKQCVRCGQTFGPEGFAPTKSPFYSDGTIPICNDCIDAQIREHRGDWSFVDKLCQWADIPFVPQEWEKLQEMAEADLFYRYASIFLGSEYEGLGWGEYFQAFSNLKQAGTIESELPLLGDEKRRILRERWGGNYDDEALAYLESLFNGLLSTQNVNGALQMDQGLKICKMSYEIDRRIAEGSDFDKLLASYDKLVKAADFTPKNVKNLNDFDTCGELVKWLERSGWVNTYYDNVPRDVVDETIANIQAFNQRLYTNETGIGEEISRRLEALKHAEQLERGDYYATGSAVEDLDNYEVDGYNGLVKEEDDEFRIELDGE